MTSTQRITRIAITLCKMIFLSTGLISLNSLADNRQMEALEFSFLVPYEYSEKIDFDGGSSIDMQGNHGFGFGIGYHWNKHLSTRFDTTWNYNDYKGTRVLDTDPAEEKQFTSRLDTIHLDLGADWYLPIDKPILPFIGVNLGWDFFDTNVPTGPSDTICWWDPWWGYMCSSSQNTYTEDAWHFGWSTGFRLDLGRRHFARWTYGERYTDIDTADGNAKLRTSRIEFGWTY